MNDPSQPPSPHAANPYATNPYAAPQAQPPAWGPPAADGRGPDGVPLGSGLFTPNHVALATFLGTPFGGAVVMAVNELRRSQKQQAAVVVLGGLVGTGLLLALGFILPDGFPTFPIGLGSLFVMAAVARSRQGALVHRHLAAGGKRASGWAAAGIGVLSLLAVFVPLVAVLVAAEVVMGH